MFTNGCPKAMDLLFPGSGLQKSAIQMLAGLAPFWTLAQLGGGHCWYTLVFLGGMVGEALLLLLVYIQLCSIPSYKDTSHWTQCLLEPILTCLHRQRFPNRVVFTSSGWPLICGGGTAELSTARCSVLASLTPSRNDQLGLKKGLTTESREQQ